MSKPPPLEHARAVKLRLRAASKKATEARACWRSARDTAFEIIKNDGALARWPCVESVTLRSMWAAEHALAAVAEEWRQCLAERAAMPVADRWDLAALERWAVAQDKDGAT